MKRNFFGAVFFPVFLVVVLAGCDQDKQQESSVLTPAKITREAQAQPTGAGRVDSPTTKVLLDYYSANLKEAKSVWGECLAKGLNNISQEDRPRCVAAHNAWEFQPYKASSGAAK